MPLRTDCPSPVWPTAPPDARGGKQSHRKPVLYGDGHTQIDREIGSKKFTLAIRRLKRRAQATPLKPSEASSEAGSACGSFAIAPLRKDRKVCAVVRDGPRAKPEGIVGAQAPANDK